MGRRFVFAALLITECVVGYSCRPPLDPTASNNGNVRLLSGIIHYGVAGMHLTADGNVLILCTVGGPKGYNVELTKCTPNGTIIFSKLLGDSSNYVSGDCLELPSGEIIVFTMAGYAYIGGHYHATRTLLKLSASGDSILYRRTIGKQIVGDAVSAYRIRQRGDKILCLSTNGSGAGSSPIVTRFVITDPALDSVSEGVVTNQDFVPIGASDWDSTGILFAGWRTIGAYYPTLTYWNDLSKKTISLENLEGGGGWIGAVRTSTNTFVVAGDSGASANPPTVCVLAKYSVDNKISLLWRRTYSVGASSTLNSLIQTSDGGFAATGYTSGSDSLIIFKFDSLGNERWHRTFGPSSTEQGGAIVEAPDQSLVVVALSSGFVGVGFSQYQLILVRYDKDGNLR